MKIEELQHINIIRDIPNNETLCNCWYPIIKKELMKKYGYVPRFDAMSDSYSIISKVLDKDCVVAYVTDKSQTTFLIKTSRQYVGFICMSEKLTKHLVSHSTRVITRMYDSNAFIDFTKDDDLIIADKDKWDKYIKTKLLDSLSNG